MGKLHHIFRRKPGNRLFRSVLITYLLLLSVTILMLAGGYTYSIQQARHDIETLQISFLEQVRRELDIRLSAVSRVSSFLASYPLTQSVSSIESEQAGYLPEYRMLDEIILEQNAMLNGDGNTIIYFDASDSVLTGAYRYRSVNLEAYTSQLGLTPDEFRDFLPDKVTASGDLRILHPGTADAELVYMTAIIDGSYNRVGTVMTRFSVSYLKESVSADHWWDGSICHMRSGSEYLYIDDNGNMDAILRAGLPDYSSVPLDAGPVALEIDGEKYMTVGLRSEADDWAYYFSVPAKEFSGTNAIYAALFAVVLCLSLFTGVVMSLYFSRRFSHPIQEILDTLKLDTAVDYPEAVSSLEGALLSYRKEMAVKQDQAARSFRLKKAGFVYGLCTGRVPPGKLNEGVEQYGLQLSAGPVALIIFQYHNVTDSIFIKDGFLDQEMMLYAGVNVVDELLCQGRGAAVDHEKQVVCLYQPEAMPGPAGLRDILKEIHDFHENVLHVGLRIYYSGQGAGLSDLPELLSVTEEMARYKQFWESDVPDILFFDEISDLSDIDPPFSLGTDKRFLNLLAIESYQDAHKLLTEQLNSGISRDLKRFQQERYKIYGLISSLVENLPASAKEGNMDDWNAALNGLLTEQSLSGLRGKVDELFQRIIAARQQKNRSAGIPSWVQAVQSYIEEHYADPQMDVSHLAKVFSLNVSYLSRTYKKATAIGVLDNIHMVRIARTKELLDSGCTVQETSAQVGYMEARALIRAFKRYEGITPGQYQEISSRTGRDQ